MYQKTLIKARTAYKFLLPGFIVYCFATIVPICLALGISLLDWRGGIKYKFVGIDNYINILQDKIFWSSYGHNIQFILTLLVTQVGIAFVVALVFQNKYIKIKEFHRRIIFLPVVMSPVVVGYLWKLIYRTDIGLIAGLFKAMGLEEYVIPWLDNMSLVIPAICLTLTWQYVGQFCIILTAGMQNVGQEIVEAAHIDGANSFQRARLIIWPLLKPTIAVCVTICISGCMKMFDIIYSMTGGGPGTSSMVTALYSYELAFSSQKMGYASSAAICMICLSLVMIVISRKILLKEDK